jgi:hypothetical protein
MNKFQKLAELNRDIELLENAGKIKAADVLHKKFIKEAQFAMPMTYNPMMFNPMAYNPMAYNPMAARTVVNPTGAVSQPAVTTTPMPVVQPRTTQVQTTGQTPATQLPTIPQAVSAPPATTSTTTTPAPASGPVNPSGIKPGTPPANLTRSTNQQGNTNQGFMQDGQGKIYIIDENGDSKYVAPPGSTVGPGLSEINPGPPTPKPVPTPPPGSPPNNRQNQLGNNFRNKIDNYFRKNPKPGVQDQYTFIGNLEDQLRQYRDSGNLTQQQYDDLSNELYVR